MIVSKFGPGQQVRHKLLGFLGVVLDVDPHYSLAEGSDFTESESFRNAPWYHVVMQDDDGTTIHTYLAEAQLAWALPDDHPEQPSMDDLAASIRDQLLAPRLRN